MFPAATPRHDEHITPHHHAWTSLKLGGEFNAAERDHITRCVQRLRLFLLCVESETFGGVLEQLEDRAA
jgi:hypothetical protein